MKLYRFSPIKNKEEFLKAIKHIHIESYKLCKQSLGSYLLNTGNIGVFCHYEEEYTYLVELRKQLTDESDNVNQKYFRLFEPIIITTKDDIPTTKYTYLYIRKPDPYRHHVGDADFYLNQERYDELKKSLLEGKKIKGARIFERVELDMIELFDPDSDVFAYITKK